MWLWVLVSCAACGRIGFDEAAQGVGIDAAGDAPNDASIPTKIYTMSTTGAAPGELFEIDLTSGQLTLVGNIPPNFGSLIGLAYWDANTLYAAGDSFVKITLSPFSVTADVAPQGQYSVLERVGANLYAISQTTSRVTKFVPGDSVGMISIAVITPGASGGDITRTSDGTWYWWTNTTQQLFTLDVETNVATAVGPTNQGAQFITGLVRDDNDNLFLIGPRLYSINRVTGLIGQTINTCKACPTLYQLASGDTTRTP